MDARGRELEEECVKVTEIQAKHSRRDRTGGTQEAGSSQVTVEE